MKYFKLSFLLLVLTIGSIKGFAYDQSVTLKVGETKTISLPSEVTSKNIYAYNCFIDSPSYVELVSYNKSSVTVKGIKEYKYTVHVSFDFFYSEGSYNRSDTHTINIDVYEEGSGGGSLGSGDDYWSDYTIDYGCWGTITVEKGKQKTVYSKYNIPSGYEGKVKCYKWSSNSSWFFSIILKNGKACVIKGDLAGSGPYSRLYCYMEYGSTSYQAYYDVVVTEPKKTLVTEITLNCDNVDIGVGETQQLTPSVFPSNASDKTVVWSSNNVDVATVSSDGLVKGIGEGSATITCRAIDGSGVSTTCNVTVKKIEPVSISLPSEMSIGIGETMTLPYTLEPENAITSIMWESGNQSIVTVSSLGEVTGVKEGTATITATTTNGKSASCKVIVYKDLVRPTKITLCNTFHLGVGYSSKISYKLEPEEATTTITWKSTNTSVVTVSSDGIVKGIKEGWANIIATTANGISAFIGVSVDEFGNGNTFRGTTIDDYNVTYRVTDKSAKTCEVYSCWEKTKTVVIPSSVQGYTVTSISQYAFLRTEIESVTLPSSVKTIGREAFSRCKSLKSISIPNSVLTIGELAFYHCENMESATLSNSIKRIEGYLFYNCKSLKNISGFNNVEYVGSRAFYNTPWFANLPEGENYIGKALYTYKGKMPANTTINVKEGCKQIAESAFSMQDGLVAITIPSSIVTIDGTPFNNCDSLRYITVSADNPIFDSRDNCNAIIKTKENELVAGCVGTTIPNTVKTIGSHAYGTATLREIIIPDNIDSIADYAYSSVKNIEKITIGKGLRVLGQSCFAQSSEIKSITVSTDNPYLDSRNNCNAIIETKNNKLLFGCDITVIPNSVETIGELAYSRSNLMMIVVPNTVTGIEDRAFGVTDNLRSITIGQNVKYLGKYLFINGMINSPWVLTSIRSLIYFPSDIDERVFCKNSTETDLIYNQTTLYVPKGSKANYLSAAGWNRFKHIVEIDDNEIYNGMCFTEKNVEGVELTYTVTDVEKKECELIASPSDVKGKVTIPSSANGFTVSSIGDKVFYSYNNNRALTEVIISNSITKIGKGTFSGCSKIENIKIPKSVESISSGILNGCVNLQSITVEEGNPYYDSRNGCNAIYVKATNKLLAGCMNTVIPEETDTIGNEAFNGHSGLKEIKLPENLKIIEGGAFMNTGISTITIPESVDSIGSSAFRCCPNLTTFKIMSKEPIRINEDVFFLSTDEVNTFNNATLYVPKGTKVKYQEADVWKNFKNIVEFEPSGIDDIVADEDKQGKIYSILGIRLKRPQKGLNIINGKKVVVR